MRYLDIDHTKDKLRTQEFGQKLFYFERLGSTNMQLLELSRGKSRQGTVVIAEQQTAGRGRQGHSWYSPPGLGLYFSLLLRPERPYIKLSGLTLALGCSVAESIEASTRLPVTVKWPNDLYGNGRKLGGMLTELQSQGGQIESAIVGVGINVNNELIPLELCETATSLFLETGQSWSREDLLTGLLTSLEEDYRLFSQQGLKAFSDRLSARFFLRNKWVSVQDDAGTTVKGVVTGFDADGALLLIDQDGQTAKCSTGTITEMER